jgi:hypothetical protein
MTTIYNWIYSLLSYEEEKQDIKTYPNLFLTIDKTDIQNRLETLKKIIPDKRQCNFEEVPIMKELSGIFNSGISNYFESIKEKKLLRN